MKLTSAEMKRILDFISTHDFTSVKTLEEAGIQTEILGTGVERQAHAIVGTPWALKLPLTEYLLSQTEREVAAVRTLWKEYPSVRSLLPAILHYNSKTGALLMLRYHSIENRELAWKTAELVVAPALRAAAGVEWILADIHIGNVGMDWKNRPKIFDLGFIMRKRLDTIFMEMLEEVKRETRRTA